jgi:cytochrome c
MSIFRPSPRILVAALAAIAAAACATAPATETPATPAAAAPAAPAMAAATPPAAFGICSACHATTANAPPKLGPNLHGVVGRKAGTAPGFDSSDALKNSGITWNATTLAAFVHDPGKTIPNNDMDYPGTSDDTAVKAIVDYMATLK